MATMAPPPATCENADGAAEIAKSATAAMAANFKIDLIPASNIAPIKKDGHGGRHFLS